MTFSTLLFVSVIVGFCGFVKISAAETQCSFSSKDSTFSHFYPIADIPESKPDGFYAKVKVSVSSDYGDVHILLAETNDLENTNRAYEFVSTVFSDGGEIRRRNSVLGNYEVLKKTNMTVEDFAPAQTTFEISVSTAGVIQVSVLSPNSTIATYKKSLSVLDDKWRVENSNYTLEAVDPQPFPVNFISFSGHSKLQFNCDYGVFIDKTHFIQTRCEAIYGWSQEELFHPLSSVTEFQPDGYYARVDISMLSDYGNLHVILSETNEKTAPNPSYEFFIADRFHTTSEFRRKSTFSESNDFVKRSSFSYNIEERRSSLRMRISVSVEGVLSFTDIHKNVTFTFTDTTDPVIPVKYITFGGYRKWPATYHIDCLHARC